MREGEEEGRKEGRKKGAIRIYLFSPSTSATIRRLSVCMAHSDVPIPIPKELWCRTISRFRHYIIARMKGLGFCPMKIDYTSECNCIGRESLNRKWNGGFSSALISHSAKNNPFLKSDREFSVHYAHAERGCRVVPRDPRGAMVMMMMMMMMMITR